MDGDAPASPVGPPPSPGVVSAPAGPSPLPEQASPEGDLPGQASPEAEDVDEADDGDEPKDVQELTESKKERKERRKKEKKDKEAAPPKPKMDKTMGYVKHEDLDWIWIGGAEDARDAVALKKHNVRYVLNCTHVRAEGGVSNFHDKDPFFSYKRLSMGDNATENLTSRFQPAWDFLETARVREDGGVLVHCQQGVSRSVSMVVAYMMKYYRFRFEDALKIAKESRSQACPNEGFTAQLKELDETLHTTNGYEKMPPKRKAPPVGAPLATVGPARPGVGPARGPVGPARPGVGPAAGPAVGAAKGPVGPARGPVGPARPGVGPQRGPVGPSAPGPAPRPAVGPAGPAKPEKRKVSGPAVGPARPEEGPSKPKKARSDAVDLT